MVKVRQDAWSHEDDLLLAETVLRHIREGSTQLNAFEEVGDKLNRTSAACGFRWNAEIRKRYEQAVAIAKRQRKEKKRALARSQAATNNVVHTEPANVIESPVRQQESSVTLDYDYTTNTNHGSINLDTVIEYLTTLKQDYVESNLSRNSLQKLESQNKELQEENEKLGEKVLELQNQFQTVQEDYQVLMQIMDRARKMVAFSDQDGIPSPAFRMEKNGNLEHVAR